MLRTRILPTLLAGTVGAVALAAARPVFQEHEMQKPTKEHQMLLQGVGQWEGTIQMFHPDLPSEPVRATEVVEPIGEFWTQATFQSEIMGDAFIGTGCMGYDTSKKAFVGTWIDSVTTSITVMEGQMNGDTLVMEWEGPDMTGAMTSHRIETVHSKDAYTSTFFQGAGEGTKTMQIQMKRKGAAAEAGAGR